MSWLVNSLANTLKLDDTQTTVTTTTTNNDQPHPPIDATSPADQTTTPRGVKDDLSDLSKTITRQLWGVASFLAPPPLISSDRSPGNITTADDADRIAGIKQDLSEIGGKFRSEISKLSSNKAVSEFTKIASNLLQFGGDEEFSMEEYKQRGVVGVTDEVVAFARDVALHPETWLDFPLPHDDDDDDDDDGDFDLSDAQQEHAFAVERLAPELAALRTELCLGYMTEGSFWKIYFVLVHPRLSKHDAVILSTPPVVKARAMLTQDLYSRGRSKQGDGNVSVVGSEPSHEEQLSVPVVDQTDSVPVEILPVEPASSVIHEIETDKHSITSTESPVIDKEVIQEVPVKQSLSEQSTATTSKTVDTADDEDDVDEWLKEDSGETESFQGTSYPLGNDDDDDDVSFSDLEEEEDVATSSKKVGQTTSTTKGSSDWIQLNSKSASGKDLNANPSVSNKVSSHTAKNKESSDWLDVEDIDDA